MKPKILFPILAVFVLALAACQPQAQPTQAPPTPTEAMEDSSGDEMMADEEEMMDEDEMMEADADDAMEAADADEEMMEDESMDEEEMMDEDMAPVTFVVRIENVGPSDGLIVLAPGAYELNDHPVSFFTPGEADRGSGLEALAEDGNPALLVESLNEMMAGDMMSFAAGVFNTPVGAVEPGPAGPGQAYEFTIEAHAGQYLTFATMFVQSNDWFYAPGPEGIALFDSAGNPLSGDITDLIFLWNAGTEVDQVPGEGPDQAPRQAGPNTGEAEDGVVTQVAWEDLGIVVTITAVP